MISNRSLLINKLLISGVYPAFFFQFLNSENKAEANQKSFDLPSTTYALSESSILSWFGNINRNFI